MTCPGSGSCAVEPVAAEPVVDSTNETVASKAGSAGTNKQTKAKENPRRRQLGRILVDSGVLDEAGLMLALAETEVDRETLLGEIIVRLGMATPEVIEKALIEQSKEDEKSAAPAAESTIRVDVHQLDALMNLVGELVLARNQILQLVRQKGDADFVAPAQRLNRRRGHSLARRSLEHVAFHQSRLPSQGTDLRDQFVC